MCLVRSTLLYQLFLEVGRQEQELKDQQNLERILLQIATLPNQNGTA